MGLVLVWRYKLICIALSLCKHACKAVCDVKQGLDPCPLLARLWDRWWVGFITFTAYKKPRFGFKRSLKAQCISNRCKDLFKQKKCFGVRGTLRKAQCNMAPVIVSKVVTCNNLHLIVGWRTLTDPTNKSFLICALAVYASNRAIMLCMCMLFCREGTFNNRQFGRFLWMF